MANDHKFWDRMAKRYAQSPVGDEAAYQEKLRRTQAVLGPDFKVLEIGCGTGSTAIALAPEVADYLATDISGEMLEIARGKAAGVENLRFERARLEDITPPEGGFDAILAHSILHLLPDKEAAIAQVLAALKPGGVFYFQHHLHGQWRASEAAFMGGKQARPAAYGPVFQCGCAGGGNAGGGV